jgi:acyl dehydratase
VPARVKVFGPCAVTIRARRAAAARLRDYAATASDRFGWSTPGHGLVIDLATVIGCDHGLDRVRFVSPIRVGDRIQSLFEVTDISPRA